MKLTSKTRGTLVNFIILGIVIGTLLWEIFERLLGAAGLSFNLAVGPIGFDIEVLALWIMVNPGSIAGAGAGVFIFKRL